MYAFFRVFEAAFYSLVNFLPYLFLALYPFLDNLRFSKKNTACLIALLSILQIGLGIFSTFTSTKTAPALSILCTSCYLVFYFLAIKEQFGKLLFMLLIASNITNLIVMAGKCLEGLLFPDMASQSNRWTFSLTTILVQLLVLPPVFLFFKKRLKHAVLLRQEKTIWKHLWLIPATFYLFWYYNLYFNSLSALQLALKPAMAIYTLLINLGALLVYSVIARTLEQADQNLKLQSDNYLLTVQTLQYENLKDRMDEIRHARHDLRQHLRVIQNIAKEKKYERLNNYLEECLKTSSSDQPISYCSHFELNALILYYAQFAKINDIAFSVDAAVSPDISISEADLTVLFGNLIENACEACLQLPPEMRTVSIKIRMITPEALVFTINNSCVEESLNQKNGQIISSKHNGYGIGIESSRNIVNRHNGFIQFEKKDDMFHVSGMISLF